MMVTLKEALKKKLNKKEMQHLVTAFDVIGDIAIIEIPDELKKKEKVIAETLLNLLNNVNVVAKKADIHKGKYRTQKIKILAGENRKETEYKENNTLLKLDVEKVYFSPRLGTERKRVYNQVKKGESVLIMFSGCAPYCCVIGKNTSAKEIYGIEVNPVAHKYALENVRLNKLENVKLFKGDVKKILPGIRKKFDRIAMPLPKTAYKFLELAISKAKKDAIVHYYSFAREEDFDSEKEKIREACKKKKRKCRILRVVKCGQASPRKYRICVDFKVL